MAKSKNRAGASKANGSHRPKKASATKVAAKASKSASSQGHVSSASTASEGRVSVRKAYKLYIGGAFVRSESGRYFQVVDSKNGGEAATENVPLGSRKDGRDAVKAAVTAKDGWASRTAFNRGQILYRFAEMLEARKLELSACLQRSGISVSAAHQEVNATIDRAIAFSGWTDKFHSLFSSLNPVGGPHFDFTTPEPMGVVAVVAPPRPALLGLVGSVLPVLAAGNTAVVLASEEDPRTAISLMELVATSDMPAGVLNLLTGRVAEILPHLAKHLEVAALDLHNVGPNLSKQAEEFAADSVKRVRSRSLSNDAWFDHDAATTPRWIERFVEMKTIWHPAGA